MVHVYQEKVTADGSASVLTVYGSKVPPNKILKLSTMAAGVYTTVMGDYVTAKYVFLGIEVNGTKHYIRGRDILPASWTVWGQLDLMLKEGDRPFAEFEATATTTTYELAVNGLMFDKEEHCKQFHIPQASE